MSNSIEHFLPNPESRQRLHAGPLARDIDGFATWLAVEGYARSSVRAKLQFIADLSRWLEHRELTVEALDEQRVEAFLHTRELRLRRRGDATTGRQLLGHLRENARIPAALPTRAAKVRSSASCAPTNASLSTSVAYAGQRQAEVAKEWWTVEVAADATTEQLRAVVSDPSSPSARPGSGQESLDLVRDHSAICHCSPSIAACRRQFGTNSVEIFRQPGNWKLVSQRAPRKIRVFLQALSYVFIVKV